MAHFVTRVRLNPADPEQGYKLWSSGLVQSIGGAPPLVWDVPETFSATSARDLVIIDWLTPSGYILSHTGRVFDFGGVSPAVGYQNTGNFHIWRRLVMNPFGNGAGYEMDFNGRIYRFGSVLPPNVGGDAGSNAFGLAGGINWFGDWARDLHMDWATKRYAILHGRGIIYSPSFTLNYDPADTRPLQDTRDLYRALAFVNPAIPVGDTAGYLSTYTGRIFGFNSAEHIRPFPIWPDRDVAVGLEIKSDGRSGRPLILRVEHRDGPHREITVSSPPDLNWIGPTGTITTTNRPEAQWEFLDAEGDAPAKTIIRLFRDDQYLAAGFDPAGPFDWTTSNRPLEEWVITDAATFSAVPSFDLRNDTYRYYGWTQDTSGEDSGDWEMVQFVVNVTPPPTPSVLASADPDSWSILLTVAAGSGTGSGLAALIEYTDDPSAPNVVDSDGLWQPVVGATAIPYPTSGPKVVEHADWQAPFNRSRRYRARTVQVSPRITSGLSGVSSDLIVTDEWVLSNASTGEAAEVLVRPPYTYTRDSGASVHRTLGRSTAVATRLGMRSIEFDLTVATDDRDEFDALEALVTGGTTLQLRDPYRRSLFVAVTGTVTTTMQEIGPHPDETTEFAFAHEHSLTLAEVSRPDP
jgi:hypothetical protein